MQSWDCLPFVATLQLALKAPKLAPNIYYRQKEIVACDMVSAEAPESNNVDSVAAESLYGSTIPCSAQVATYVYGLKTDKQFLSP